MMESGCGDDGVWKVEVVAERIIRHQLDKLIADLVVDLEELEVCHVFQDLAQLLLVEGAIDEFTGSDYAYSDVGLPDVLQLSNNGRAVFVDLDNDIGVTKD